MTWTITADGATLYDSRIAGEVAKRYVVIDPTADIEMSKAGGFRFTLPPFHPLFDAIKNNKTEITVYESGNIYFRGRVISDEIDIFKRRTISCEGALAYLNDSIQRPFQFPEDPDAATPEDYLAFLIARHNEQVGAKQQFTVGNVTVTDPNDYIARSDTEYSTTWKLIKDGLLDTLGGYLIVRYESGTAYLDYLASIDTEASQPLMLGLNLLDISTARKGEDVATAILPLGKQDEETGLRLTLEGLPDGTEGDYVKAVDILYSPTAETALGARITRTVMYDDITLANNLKNRAADELARLIGLPATISITGADLSAAGYPYGTYHVGTIINVYAASLTDAHALEARYLLRKMSVKLFEPNKTKITLGATVTGFTAASSSLIGEAVRNIEINVAQTTAAKIREVERRTTSEISQTESRIQNTVAENYYLKGETDELVGTVSTQVTQTANSLRLDFANRMADVEAVAQGADARVNNLEAYISAENGVLSLGYKDNSFKQVLSQTKNSFYESGAETAYMSNRKLYIDQAEILTSIIIGNFGAFPRSNGNLRIGKVT